MKFIIILLCLGLERYFRLALTVRRIDGFTAVISILRRILPIEALWSGWLGTLVAVVPIVLSVGVVHYLLAYWVLGIFGFILSALILWYCLGPNDLFHQLHEYFDAAEQKDDKQFKHFQTELIGEKLPKTKHEQYRAMTNTIASQANSGLLAVVFWFVILGPVGAVLYRISTIVSQLAQAKDNQYSAMQQQSEQLVGILDWLPARITAMTYCLAGDLARSVNEWISYAASGIADNAQLLSATLLAALGIEEDKTQKSSVAENKAAFNLIDRALLILIVMIAIFTLGAWIY